MSDIEPYPEVHLHKLFRKSVLSPYV